MTTITIKTPTAEKVTALVHGLLGLDVKPAPSEAGEVCSIAEYVDQDGTAVGYCACDLASACRLAAALTQIPAGRVDEAIKDGVLPESFAENLDEIFNICVNLVVPSDGSRVVLGRTAHGPASEHFAELKAAHDSGTRKDFGFEVARYGRCHFDVSGCL
ncbi:MAG: hypothetical protein R3C19_24075 [Planctomycetaceae bacterium]